MKLLVFDKNEPVEKVIRLALIEVPNGIDLVAVDENGFLECALLRISPDGLFFRHPDIPTSLGFDVDTNGCIELPARLVENIT